MVTRYFFYHFFEIMVTKIIYFNLFVSVAMMT